MIGHVRVACVALLALVLALPACPPSVPKVAFDPTEAFDQRNDAMGHTVAPNLPAVKRGGSYAGFKEQFNRYYTDRDYQPKKTISVGPKDDVKAALSNVAPGTKVIFKRGSYNGCWSVDTDGTYDAPIILYAERNTDGSRGVRVQCCGFGRNSCFNFEGASYVAVDGFEIHAGAYGVRAVGSDYAATQHSWGIAVLNTRMEGQGKDGVLTGAVDWSVFENNVISESGEEDGHGIYLSNGSDLNIVRNNDLFANESSTFQINPDPASTCGGNYKDEDCDGVAGTGDGGRGAGDFFLIENNYFHDGDVGSNFASTRYSTVRNNVFASWTRHGVSFYSDTGGPKEKTYNPKLGAHHNRIYHNLFAGKNDRHILQIINHADYNDVRNNLFIAMTVSGDTVRARPTGILLESDDTGPHNVYANNVFLAGKFDGPSRVGPTDLARPDLDPKWFTKLPTALPNTVSDFKPKSGAPFLDRAPRIPSVTLDRDGKPRGSPADVGPFEL